MMNILWIFVTFLCVKGQRVTLLTESPAKNITYVEEFENVTVTCEVSALGGKTVRWYHNEKQIALVAKGNSVIYLDPNDEEKYSLTGADTTGGNFTFTIINFSEDDAGAVACDVSSITPATRRYMILRRPVGINIVFQSARSIYEDNPKLPILHVRKENWVNLTCKVFGSRPSADIIWTWNDTNPIILWTAKAPYPVEDKGLYNTSSDLFLPPMFSFDVYRGNATKITTPDTSNVNTATSITKTKPRATVPTQRTVTESITGEMTVDHSVKFTCSVSVEEDIYERSLLVHVGPYKSGGANCRKNFSSLVLTVSTLICVFIQVN
ncbi:uncharacterized protein LOC143461240 [Clavelina lepadiformis]|uniref:uncharacterized protein LOC143461240 n=1 Tax=Clavelina lepadiformis TaxID=159417 RepID=UPI0040429D0A